MTTSAHAARIVRRTGFGASGHELDTAAGMPLDRLVDATLAPGAAPSKDSSLGAPDFPALPHGAKNDSIETKARRRTLARDQLQQLTLWWLRRMVTADRPFEEKLTLVWHNHFATAATKVRSAPLMLTQNATLRAAGRGDFRELALAMLTDPAMLVWLDGRRNTVAAPNENLSREFMELFTLGHGAYTETDVREGARALTGWKLATDGTVSLNEAAHDRGIKTVLGVHADLDAAGFCDAVLARPGSARYVATRMWHQFASQDDPPADVLDALVAAYGPSRDVTELLRAMLIAPEFGSAAGTLVVTPVEWLIGAARALKVSVDSETSARQLLTVLRALGQVPFYPPSVAGWPSGQAWLSTASVTTRLSAARALAGRADLAAVTGVSSSSRVEAVAHLLGIPSLTDRSAGVLKDAAASPVQLVTLALNSPEYLTH